MSRVLFGSTAAKTKKTAAKVPFENIESVNLGITNGIDPDISSLSVIYDDSIGINPDKELPGYGPLVLDDGTTTTSIVKGEEVKKFIHGQELTIPDCRRSNLNYTKMAANGGKINASISDWRYKWGYSSTVTGEYNRRDKSGTIVGEKKTLKELLELLVGIERVTVNGKSTDNQSGDEYKLILPDDGKWIISAGVQTDSGTIYPYSKWETAERQSELQTLCENYGYVISPTWIETAKKKAILRNCTIWQENKKDSVKPSDSIIAKYAIKNNIIKNSKVIPEKIKCIGSRNLYEQVLNLEAVCLDVLSATETIDGKEIKIYETLMRTVKDANCSYRPANGYYDGFENEYKIPIVNEDEDELRAQTLKAINTSLFKYYRLPQKITIGENEYTREEAMELWANKLVKGKISLGDESKYSKPYIGGKYKTDEVFINIDRTFESKKDINEIPFVLDKKLGCVVFEKRVFDILEFSQQGSIGSMIGATIQLVGAFGGEFYELKDKDDKDYDLKPKLDAVYGEDKTVEVVKKTYATIIRRDLFKQFILVTGNNWVEATTNDQVDLAAQQRVEKELFPRFAQSVIDGQNINLVGLFPVSVNGNIENVAINISVSSGPFTAIGVGREIEPYTMPRKIRERQLYQTQEIKDSKIKKFTWNVGGETT